MNKYINNSLSTYLFAEPNFLDGFAFIIDIGANLKTYNFSKSNKESDYKALFTDWAMVGKDLEDAINNFEYQTELSE